MHKQSRITKQLFNHINKYQAKNFQNPRCISWSDWWPTWCHCLAIECMNGLQTNTCSSILSSHNQCTCIT